MTPLLFARDIVKSYGAEHVLKGVSLRLEPGQMIAVMGPSGCGKSTLLHILGLLQAPDSGGTYQALGRNLLGLDHKHQAHFRKQFFGFILQSCAMFAFTTAAENVEYPLIYAGVPRRERLARVAEALEAVNMGDKGNAWSSHLSGGEQQRVAIARALVNRPRILLADEPTGQLDSQNTDLLMRHVRKASDELSLGCVIVTHDPKVAAHCDVVHRLVDGFLEDVSAEHGARREGTA